MTVQEDNVLGQERLALPRYQAWTGVRFAAYPLVAELGQIAIAGAHRRRFEHFGNPA